MPDIMNWICGSIENLGKNITWRGKKSEASAQCAKDRSGMPSARHGMAAAAAQRLFTRSPNLRTLGGAKPRHQEAPSLHGATRSSTAHGTQINDSSLQRSHVPLPLQVSPPPMPCQGPTPPPHRGVPCRGPGGGGEGTCSGPSPPAVGQWGRPPRRSGRNGRRSMLPRGGAESRPAKRDTRNGPGGHGQWRSACPAFRGRWAGIPQKSRKRKGIEGPAVTQRAQRGLRPPDAAPCAISTLHTAIAAHTDFENGPF